MGDDSAPRETCCEGRRRLLRAMAGLGAAAALGCGGREHPAAAGPPSVEIPLSKIPAGTRVVLPVGHQPVEFQRTAGGVTARSLACTHQGCEVAWVEEQGLYQCPCHDGRYDAQGNVLAGPPPAPLRAIVAEVRGDAVFAHL